MTENEIQKAYTQYVKLKTEMYLHIGNEGARSTITGRNLKLAGLAPGFPDCLILEAKSGFYGLAIELKAEKGILSIEQLIWLNNLNNHNYLAVVCYSLQSAINVTESYFKNKIPKLKIKSVVRQNIKFNYLQGE